MIRIGGHRIWLSAACTALSVVIALEVFDARRPGASDGLAAAAMPVPGVGEQPGPSSGRRDGWLKDILARPLFSPGRRPVDGGIRGLPRLTGIVVAGSQRIAIFAGPSGSHPIVAPAGTQVGAFRVLTVADTGVIIAGPNGTTLIRPAFDAAVPPALPSPLARARVEGAPINRTLAK